MSIKIRYLFYLVSSIIVFSLLLYFLSVGNSNVTTVDDMYSFQSSKSMINYRLKEDVKELNVSTIGLDVESDVVPTDVENYQIHDRAKDYWGFVKKYATERNIDPVWIAAMITNESCWDKDCTSYTGAAGLMQIESAQGTWGRFGEGDPYDPEANIKAGVKLFEYQLGRAAHYGHTDRDKGALSEQYKHALLIYGSGEGNYINTNYQGTVESQHAYNQEVKFYKGYISGEHSIGDWWQ